MDKRVEEIKCAPSVDDELDALFGDYTGVDHSGASTKFSTSQDGVPPRLFPDTFSYARAMLQRLAEPAEGIFKAAPAIDLDNRLIRMCIPSDMMSDGGLGYARSDEVDDRYMPVEAVGNGGLIELTDRTEVINTAIENAKTEDRSWPTVQYLWDGHPILGWFGDRAEIFFPERSAPLCGLRGRLDAGEVAVLLHGAIPNALGAPIVDRWAVVSVKGGRVSGIEAVGDFTARVGLAGNTPNSGAPEVSLLARRLRRPSMPSSPISWNIERRGSLRSRGA